MVLSEIMEKIYILKNTPNISSVDSELLLKLENLLGSEDYSNALNDTISIILDEMFNNILKKHHILNLTALLNNLSLKSKINYIPNLKTESINLSQLVKIVNEANEEKSKHRKRTAIKEKIKGVLKVIFYIIAFIFILILVVALIPLILDLIAFLWDLFLNAIYILIFLVIWFIFGGRPK